MCLANNITARPVTFFDTILYGAEGEQGFHYLGYFNKVRVSGAATEDTDQHFGWRTRSAAKPAEFGWRVKPQPKKKGNAMLFAVPAVPGSIDKDSLIPVAEYPNFMKDLKRAVAPVSKGLTRGTLRSRSFSVDAMPAAIVVQDFDKGTYTVVIAARASQIADVIAQVPEEKRPESNPALWAEMDKLYPNWTFVLFCFSEDDAAKAGCALIKYKPMRDDVLYLPGLDGHAGVIGWDPVDINHTLVVSSHRLGDKGIYVSYTDKGVREALPFLYERVIGRVYEDRTVPQGDFLFSIKDIREGVFRCKREVPPGADEKLAEAEPTYLQ